MIHINDRIALGRLDEVTPTSLSALMNHPLVRRHLPLAHGPFDPEDCERFVESKERMWVENGYGPWAITVDGMFAGWGGLQLEGSDTDVALVLHPDFWGEGKTLYPWFINYAFSDLGLESVTTLLPPSRRHVAGVLRLGFQREGEVTIENESFTCYRLRSTDLTGAGHVPSS